MTCSPGTLAQLLIEPAASPHTFDTSSEEFAFKRENIRLVETFDTAEEMIRGTRAKWNNQVRLVRQSVAGSFVVPLTTLYANRMAARVTGSTYVANGAAYTPSATMDGANATFGVQVYRSSDLWTYSDCKCNELVFRSSAGQTAEMECSIIGKTETKTADTSPAAVTYGTSALSHPLTHADLLLSGTSLVTINSVAYMVDAVEFRINNGIEPLFYNSATATDICSQTMSVTLTITGSLGNLIDIHDLAAETAYSATVQWRHPTSAISVAVSSAAVRLIKESPVVSGRSNIPYTAKFEMFATTAATDIVSITVDNLA